MIEAARASAFSASRSCSSGLAAITARRRATKSRAGGGEHLLSDRVEGVGHRFERGRLRGAAAIPSASSLGIVSPPKSTSRLSGKWRKKVLFVRPARSAISTTVVFS